MKIVWILILNLVLGSYGMADEHDHHAAFATPPAETEIRVTSGDLFFRVEGRPNNQPIELVAGKRYRLTFTNVGSIMHEVLFGRNPSTEADGSPGDYQEQMLSGFEVKVKGKGFEVEAQGLNELELSSGVALSVIFTVPHSLVGNWEIGCFMPGHYMAGMKLPVIVRR